MDALINTPYMTPSRRLKENYMTKMDTTHIVETIYSDDEYTEEYGDENSRRFEIDRDFIERFETVVFD
jgi:hypothetical protein